METIAKVVSPITAAFESLGLNTPLLRMVATSSVTGTALLLTRPNLWFTEADGVPKTWSIFKTKEMTKEEVTIFPWYMVAMSTGTLASLL